MVKARGDTEMRYQALKTLEKFERAAWKTLMNGTSEDACNLYGKEGKNEIAWRKAADACYKYREENNLLGLNWKQINAVAGR
jgi:hypothetical protein